jgi:hypothetical protein
LFARKLWKRLTKKNRCHLKKKMALSWRDPKRNGSLFGPFLSPNAKKNEIMHQEAHSHNLPIKTKLPF